jgi:hypothetical protein
MEAIKEKMYLFSKGCMFLSWFDLKQNLQPRRRI